ncbi:MAG: transcription elongation factor GreA [bacterium]|nr:transcription elongation factor GreA [bacterium]
MNKILPKREARIIFTRKGYDDLLKERDGFLNERPEAVKNLTLAREMGDLSENGYYRAARARLSFLDSRLRHIEHLIKLAEIKETIDNDTVGVGSRVIVLNDKIRYEYTIVGGYESDPVKKKISHLSPLGKALIGKKINEKINVATPAGAMTYTVIKIYGK